MKKSSWLCVPATSVTRQTHTYRHTHTQTYTGTHIHTYSIHTLACVVTACCFTGRKKCIANPCPLIISPPSPPLSLPLLLSHPLPSCLTPSSLPLSFSLPLLSSFTPFLLSPPPLLSHSLSSSIPPSPLLFPLSPSQWAGVESVA